MAAFDFDDTLITAAVGSKWTRSATGWSWWHSSVPSKLKSLHAQGFNLVVISNQGNISLKENAKTLQKDQLSLANLKNQFSAVTKQLELPITFYGATSQDQYRKPRTGMWKRMQQDLGLESADSIDLDQSFFVGDAGGRAKMDKRNKDHACSDRDLAANIGIKFLTPEEYFLEQPAESFGRDFDPKDILQEVLGDFDESSRRGLTRQHPLEIIIFCGSPASGKSSLYWKHFQPLGYERVNQDLLKTRDRCLKVARDNLESGKPIVVDNTNRNEEARAYWIRLAKEFRVPIRCIHLTASTRLCQHNDCIRALSTGSSNPEKRSMLPSIAFRGFAQSFVEPKIEEGFQDVVKVPFKFQGTAEEQQKYSQYWVSNFAT